ncbi:MAG: adenine phosphoribosyltransferase [Phycisphaerae bacterium]|nr:adenine phosphoribosyltransferase [Phycisphaerae bacterium]
MTEKIDLKKYIRNIPDWPKPDILFRDITPLLADRKAFSAAVDAFCALSNGKNIDYVAAIDARGFIFGSAVAIRLGAGFIPIRKKGKLPFTAESEAYELEYGQAVLEIHADAVKKGSNVLMIDDLLATGGTMAASCRLIEKIGGNIAGIIFLIELLSLKGKEKLKNYDARSIITFE